MGQQLDIGSLIQERRQHLGLAQENLAAKLDVTFLPANLWENNREKHSPLLVEKIDGMLRSLLNAPSVTLPHVMNRLVALYFIEGA